jgi:hypothetical protein
MASSTSIKEMQNPSIVLYGAKDARLEDKPIPELTDPHQVLVRINYVGVCGSDVKHPSPHPQSSTNYPYQLPFILKPQPISPHLSANVNPRSTSGTTAASEKWSTPAQAS